jgi:hypothetical protein
VRPDAAPCNDANELGTATIADETGMERRKGPEVSIHEPEGDRLRDVPLTPLERDEGVEIHWGGARMLARIGPDTLTFEETGRR